MDRMLVYAIFAVGSIFAIIAWGAAAGLVLVGIAIVWFLAWCIWVFLSTDWFGGRQ